MDEYTDPRKKVKEQSEAMQEAQPCMSDAIVPSLNNQQVINELRSDIRALERRVKKLEQDITLMRLF